MENNQIRIKKNEVFCPTCGNIGKPKLMTRGSIFIEILLWICFIIPGLIYSLWRQTTKYKACRFCQSISVIPGTAPNVYKLIEKFQA